MNPDGNQIGETDESVGDLAGAEQSGGSGDSDSADLVQMALVRIGVHGQVGRFSGIQDSGFGRGSRVLCRTPRGLEVGQVLSQQAACATKADGLILRVMGPDDELLWGHLQALASEASHDCQEWLNQHGCEAVLLEVEPLMDGRTLYFHFLNEQYTDQGLQSHVDHLAQVFEEKARNSEFAAQLEEGCGPGCGTESAVNGCGSKGGCAVCKLASACKTR
ncbi:MAG: PSP1 C-terminal domain-containing protein [Aureliella sp.]